MDTHFDNSHAPQSQGAHYRRAVRGEDMDRRLQEEGMELRPHLTASSLWVFAALAHELKQPLAAILSNAQAAWRFLASDTPDLQEVRTSLVDIITDARRTDEVLRGLQAFVTTG